MPLYTEYVIDVLFKTAHGIIEWVHIEDKFLTLFFSNSAAAV